MYMLLMLEYVSCLFAKLNGKGVNPTKMGIYFDEKLDLRGAPPAMSHMEIINK